MANNLKKFTTEAEYSAATLNYPAVSWVTSGDTVHFDKAAPAPVVNDKVMIGFTVLETSTRPINLYNPYGTSPSTYFSSITFNDVAVSPIAPTTTASVEEGVFNITKYGITTTSISDCFSGELGEASMQPPLYILIPSQITSVDSFPTNDTQELVIEATTPPTLTLDTSELIVYYIYVPDEAVTAYQNSVWNEVADSIYPISQYSGNLPV